MKEEYSLVVDMTVSPGEARPFVAERLADILATIISEVVNAYCDGVVGGTVSITAEKEVEDGSTKMLIAKIIGDGVVVGSTVSITAEKEVEDGSARR